MSRPRPSRPAVLAATSELAARREHLDAAALLAEVPRCARGLDLGGRRSATLREAVELVGVYFSVLAPPAGWRPVAHGDKAAALGEADVVWRDERGQVLADVLDCGGAGVKLWTPRTRGVPRRLARAGREALGQDLLAVRLLALSAPARSLAVTDADALPRPLTDTPWWFAAPPVDCADGGEQEAAA